MAKSSGAVAYQLSFQASPIFLTNGVAGFIPGIGLPIVAITQGISFLDGLLGAGDDTITPDRFFAHFKPIPGATLIVNRYGKYTFANQTVAANAVIGDPLKVSMQMDLHIENVANRLAVMSALAAILELHSNLGGTYTVATPSYIYTNCLLNSLTCTGDNGTIPQGRWVWDFEKPLLSADSMSLLSFNGMMSNIVNAVPSTGALSGTEVTGSSLSLATPSVMPAASGLAGNVASYDTPL